MSQCFSSSRHHDHDGSSSSTPLLRQNYEVFLSFRGEDTRRGFTDHLFHRLDDQGIAVFRDSEELRVGEKIDLLLEAIKASKISVPVISPDYAASMWCLKELLQIIDCNKTQGQLVLPIFYKVTPSDVREQKGVFGEKFWLYKEKNKLDGKLVQDLQNAFKQVASMKGWESDIFADGHEGTLVKAVFRRIIYELKKHIRLSVPDPLVGVDDHIKAIKEKFDGVPSNDAKIIVIHGMSGIGKTTLAKALYNEFSESFECQSFVPNIRERSLQDKGMVNLQKQMIRDILVDKAPPKISHEDEGITTIERRFKGKRLLLVLDDVKDKVQLDKLAAKNNWFGPESIVIITTVNKDVVVAPTVNLSYELKELDYNQSYRLFCKRAFEGDAPCPRDLETIARNIASMTGGLPLAIEVIGSFLHKKRESIWRDTEEKLRRKTNSTVHEKLKISYDALDHEQKQIFLDIACLMPIRAHIEVGFEFFTYMWKACDFYPDEGIDALVSLSLIKVLDGVGVVMHDQLKDLGREIICSEGRDEIGKRSRIWLPEEATKVIEGKQGTRNIQALVLDRNRCKAEQFEGMDNLRFLSLRGEGDLTGDFENLIPNLRWFHWEGRHLSDITRINFNPKKLVMLYLHDVIITESWKGWKQMKDLKVLTISRYRKLTEIPDLSAVNALEHLRLRFCGGLRKIHPSIGRFSKTLKTLNVYGCTALKELPLEVGKMEELRELNISWTRIKEIPISDGYMLKLESLDASLCDELISIPDSIGKLSKLVELDLVGCGKLESLSNLPCNLSSLRFQGDSMETLTDISKLTILKHLTYWDSFERRNKVLNVGKLNQLESLTINSHRGDDDLDEEGADDDLDEEGSSSEEEIEISNPAKEMAIAPENFTLLPELPSSLVELKVYRCQTLRTLPSLSNLKNLSRINLKDCSKLREINILEGAESLTHLKIKGCRNLSRLGDLSNLKMLRVLSLDGCGKLSDVEGIEKLTSLTGLHISGCNPNINIPDLSMLRNLKRLTITDAELMEIPWLQELKSLKELTISSKSLQYLPDLSHLTELRRLDISDCEKLIEIRGIENMKSLRFVQTKGCTALRKLPDLPIVDIESDGSDDWQDE